MGPGVACLLPGSGGWCAPILAGRGGEEMYKINDGLRSWLVKVRNLNRWRSLIWPVEVGILAGKDGGERL